MTEQGPELTDFGIEAFYSKDTLMPEEYGGGWTEYASSITNLFPMPNALPMVIRTIFPHGIQLLP